MSILCGAEALPPSLVQPCDLGRGLHLSEGEQWEWFFQLLCLSGLWKVPRQGNFPCLCVQGKSLSSAVHFRPEIKLNSLIIHKVGNSALLLKLLKPVEISQNYEADKNKLVENNYSKQSIKCFQRGNVSQRKQRHNERRMALGAR